MTTDDLEAQLRARCKCRGVNYLDSAATSTTVLHCLPGDSAACLTCRAADRITQVQRERDEALALFARLEQALDRIAYGR